VTPARYPAAGGVCCRTGRRKRIRVSSSAAVRSKAGFTQVTITPTDDAGGLSSAVIRAVRPAAPDEVLIRPMRAADAAEVLAVYQAGLDTGHASFETAAPAWEGAGIWTVQSGVFPEDTASLRLHGRAGFRVAGVRERVGCHHGQ
jgi:hypothetical protein